MLSQAGQDPARRAKRGLAQPPPDGAGCNIQPVAAALFAPLPGHLHANWHAKLVIVIHLLLRLALLNR